MKKLISFLSILLILQSCDLLKNVDYSDLEKVLATTTTTNELTNTDIVQGLKEALNVGTQNAVQKLSLTDGFFKDPILKIPFPPEVVYVEEKLRALGMGKLVDDFVLQMNRGAEKAVVKATPIFADAITSMSFSDAKAILKGTDNAATTYFKNNTSTALSNAFKPEVQKTLDQMQVTKYWSDVTTAYNRIPLTKKVETDLAKYVTDKALDGLWMKLAVEEKKIRQDPVARVTDILKKVFGSLD